MTTSRRQPSPTEPCILPDASADPPELFLAWERPCTTIAFSSVGASNDLSSEQVLGIVQRSIGAWEAVSCDGTPLGIDIQVRSDTSTCEAPLYRDGGGNANTLIFQETWPLTNDAEAFALTTVWHRRSTGEILDVDIEVNEERGPYGVCPAEGCTDARTVDLENVLTHELGHYLGLAHSTETEATMFVSAVAGEVLKRDLHPDDIAGICTVYPSGSPSEECNYEPRGG
ncbi:MAG: matrixin family metalloprotease, partial [Sandaracinaceae bacterium]